MNNKSSLANGLKIFSIIILVFSVIFTLAAGPVLLVIGIGTALPIYIMSFVLQVLVDIRENSYQTNKRLESIENSLINAHVKQEGNEINN